MYVIRRTKAIIPLLLTLVAAACGGDGGTGPEPQLPDLAAVADAADALMAPVQITTVPTVSLDSAYASLTARGLVFDRSPSRLAARAWSLAGVEGTDIARVEFPAEMLGQTYVLDTDQGDWVIDPDRNGAPADGVRIIWYSVDTGGNISLPLTEQGYVDLTDEDTDVLSQLGVRMVSTGGSGEQVLAQFTQGYWTQGDIDWSEHFEATGFYNDGLAVVDFDLASDASGSDATGDQTFSFVIELTGTSSSYAMNITGTQDGSTGVVDETFLVTMTQSAVPTVLDMSFTIPPAGDQTGGGSVSHNSARVANIDVSGSSFRYTPPNGGTFSNSQKTLLDIFVQTMLLNGLAVFLTLPLLYL